MEHSAEPQTEREWMMKLSGQIDSLTKSIDGLANKLVDIEKTQIVSLAKEISGIKQWQQQIQGGWKLVVVIWVVVTAIGFGAIIKLFIQ